MDLLNNKEDRSIVLSSSMKANVLEVLKQFGKITDYMTEPMVAEFYGVTTYTLNKIGTRNKEELGKYGYKSYSKAEVEKIQKTQLGFLENIPNRGLRLYPIDAVIVIGMMLTESKVAEELRSCIMQLINKDISIAFNGKVEDSRKLTSEDDRKAQGEMAWDIMCNLKDTREGYKVGELINEVVNLERMRKLESNTKKITDKINVTGLNPTILKIVFTKMNMGKYGIPKGKQTPKFYPNDNFNILIEKGWCKFVGEDIKFYLEFADEINRIIETNETIAKMFVETVQEYRNKKLNGMYFAISNNNFIE